MIFSLSFKQEWVQQGFREKCFGRSDRIVYLIFSFTVSGKARFTKRIGIILSSPRLTKKRVFRGSEERVLDRFVKVIEAVKPSVIIRLTGDNPFVDPELLDVMIQAHFDQGSDYTYILNAPLGICGEVVNANLLIDISRIQALEDQYQEHVTLYIRNHPALYRVQFLEAPERFRAPQYRLTIDTKEDYESIKALYQKAGERPDVSASELITLLNRNPDAATEREAD